MRKARVRIAMWSDPIGPKSGFGLEKRIEGRVYQCKIGPRDLLSFAEMADLLSVTVQAVHLWHGEKKLKVVKHKGQYRIPFSEVKRLLIERGVDPYVRSMERQQRQTKPSRNKLKSWR